MYGSTYFTNETGNNFLQIDIWPAASRIASHLDQIVFYNTQTSVFNSIQVANVYNYSDINAKSNILPLKNTLSIVKNLNPVSYNWKNNAQVNKFRVSKSDKKEIGFVAQEVEKILPELVIRDSAGKELVNYSGIIPILTSAIKELSEEVESLKDEVTRLKKNAELKEELGLKNNTELSVNFKGKLGQNIPNPSSGTTSISYNIQKDFNIASINLYDLNGNLKMQKILTKNKVGEIQFNTSLLRKGIYVYTLLIDNEKADTKRLTVE